MSQPFRFHFSCGALFFSSSTACQRMISRMSSLPVRSAVMLRRLILDGAIDHLVDERQLVLVAVDLLLAPVVRVLRVGVGIALHEVGQQERAGAVDVLPVAGAGVDDLLRHDAGVVAPAEAIVPLGVVVLEVEDDRVLVGRLDLVEMVEIGRRSSSGSCRAGCRLKTTSSATSSRASITPGLSGNITPLRSLISSAERILLPLPALGKFAADRVRWEPGVGVERVLAAAAASTSRGRRRTAARRLAGIVVVLPVPVGVIP